MVKLIRFKEFLERYIQGMRNLFYIHDGDIPAASFHPGDITPVQIGGVGKVFLRHALYFPQLFNALSQAVSYVRCVHIAKV